MKAIIIEDKDSRQLLDSLELKKLELPVRQIRFDESGRTGFGKLTEAEREGIIENIHASFHYVVCRWLRDQGADVVRKG